MKKNLEAGDKPLFHVVLVEPEIPNNTGNIGRTCVGLCSKLHLVGKLGFSLDEKYVRRSGLDYWKHLDFQTHATWEEFLDQVVDPHRLFFFETKSKRSLYEAEFEKGDYLVFGRETKGIHPEILEKYPGQAFEIPFLGPVRSFNLANSVSMVMGEGFRQLLSGSDK